MLWLILGIGIGFGLFTIISRVSAGKLSVKWYQWVLGIISIIMILFTLQNYFGLSAELEPQAANFMLLVSGLPAIIIAALIWLIPYIAKFQKKESSGKELSL